jgi:hypothetical protein
MSAPLKFPLTLYVCPACETVDQDQDYTGGHDFNTHPECHRNQRVPVRVIAFDTAVWVLTTALVGAGMPRQRAEVTAIELLNDAERIADVTAQPYREEEL